MTAFRLELARGLGPVLVALDFDGTLAPITPHRAAVLAGLADGFMITNDLQSARTADPS